MKRFKLIWLFFFFFFISRGQNGCFFLRDTGTAETETSQSLIELSDGSVYVTGTVSNGPLGDNDAALLKFDSCGTLLWEKYLGDTSYNQGLYINKTGREELVIAGVTGNTQSGNDILLYKLDTSGVIIFNKRFSSAQNQSAKYVQETSDKGFLLCGFIADNSGSNDLYVIKTDSAGNLLWQQQLGTNKNEYANGAIETTDGNYLVVGDAESHLGDYDAALVKLRPDGSVVWNKTYTEPYNNGTQGVIETSAYHYLFFGETELYTGSAFDFFIQQTDTAGISLSRHAFGGNGTDAIFSLAETTGHELVCTGYSRSYNGQQAYDIVLFTCDTMGNIKWLKNFYNPGVDIGYQLKRSVFGGYLITGLWGDDNDNYFLCRSDTIANTDAGIYKVQMNQFLVYPNPSVENFYIKSRIESKLTIYSLLGDQLKEQKISIGENIINAETLSNGIYMLKLSSQAGITILPLMIAH